MAKHQPQLPLVYEPVALKTGDSVRQHSMDLAERGAAEGTLIWAKQHPDGEARPGKTWYAPDDGLYLALLMEPDYPDHQAGQVGLVALIAMGIAMAEHVAPMTDLAYRWPNDILLSGSKVAGLWLDKNRTGDRLVLNIAVNVAQPPGQVFDAGSVRVDGGAPDLTPEQLLESFARHFLEWINRWAEEGMSPILNQFRSRHAKPGMPVLLQLANRQDVAGSLVVVDDEGCLVVELDGQPRTIRPDEFFGLK